MKVYKNVVSKMHSNTVKETCKNAEQEKCMREMTNNSTVLETERSEGEKRGDLHRCNRR